MTEAQQAELRQDVRLKYGTLITDEGTWELMEFAYMSGMNRAARCNDTAPVAPIGDAKLDAIANDHFTDGNHLTTHQWRSYARALLAAVAAQGAK